MKDLHFKRRGSSSHSQLRFKNCFIELYQGDFFSKNKGMHTIIMKKYIDISCNKIEKTESKTISLVNPEDNVIEIIKEIVETFLKNNTCDENINLETWIEAYYPGSNTGYFSQNDISIMNVILQNGKITSIKTDNITVEKAIENGVDLYSTCKKYYWDKAADKIKDLLSNPPSKMLEMTMSELYMLIHNNSHKDNLKELLLEKFN